MFLILKSYKSLKVKFNPWDWTRYNWTKFFSGVIDIEKPGSKRGDRGEQDKILRGQIILTDFLEMRL